jgi:hypothetical protein
VKDRDDPFDDLDNLRLEPAIAAAAAAVVAAAAKQAPQRRRSREPFTKFPHSWEARLLQAKRISSYRVALHVLYLHWRAGGRPIPLSNIALADKGVSRQSKWNALVELAHLGLIKIEKRRRKSPVIVVLVG